MRTMLVIALVLLLLVIALPANGTTDEYDNGVTLINGQVLAPAGTSHATVKYVEAITGVELVPQGTYGNQRNVAV